MVALRSAPAIICSNSSRGGTRPVIGRDVTENRANLQAGPPVRGLAPAAVAALLQPGSGARPASRADHRPACPGTLLPASLRASLRGAAPFHLDRGHRMALVVGPCVQSLEGRLADPAGDDSARAAPLGCAGGAPRRATWLAIRSLRGRGHARADGLGGQVGRNGR